MSTPVKKRQSPTARRVAAYRNRMREAGFVARTIWVPDTSDPTFAIEYDRQCRAIAEHERTNPEAQAVAEAWFEASDWPRGTDDIPDYDPPKET